MTEPRFSRQTFLAQTAGLVGSVLTLGILASRSVTLPKVGAVPARTNLKAVPAARAISRPAQR